MDKLKILIQTKMNELIQQETLTGKRIFLFGYVIYTEYIDNFLHDKGYKMTAILDNDQNKQGKNFFDIPIIAPEDVDWRRNDVVLIVSIHEKSMVEQIRRLSVEADVIVLADRVQYEHNRKEREKFWTEENYKWKVRKLYQGAAIYERLKGEEILMAVLSALGDMFACGFYFREYERKVKSKRIKIVAASKGVYKVAQLYGIKNIVMISNQEMELLVEYMLLYRAQNDIVYEDISILNAMAGYKKIPFPEYWARYFLRLGRGYQVYFPSIWDTKCQRREFINKGIVEGKSVILAPYANTLKPLPYQFWEILTDELLKMGYRVFTNIAGTQKPVKNSIGLEIPLNQLGNYLEFAGTFIALRSGLCDVAGRSRCRQIIIFRDGNIANASYLEMFDLRCEKISNNPIQYVYDNNDFYRNIEWVINALRDTKAN